MTAIRRLVLCLDGTRNDKEHSTNVQHHFSLASEYHDRPIAGDSVTQIKCYIEGIGSGPASTRRDAAFGLSLGRKLRAAYYWLVENFEDATPHKPADEVYIFGFSRGAFTARELVGLVSNCGLLRRGAPLTVNEIWQSHSVLARAREQHSGELADLFGPEIVATRRLADLVWDPWRIRETEAYAATRMGGVPGQRTLNLNDSEELLIRWSRRIKITYLGLYDTVGAVGWGAPEVPGVMTQLPRHEGVRPSALIQSCRHALAIDEHRSAFRHTPFVAFIDRNSTELAELGRRGSQRTDGQDVPRELAKAWSDRIEQRWFIGAHANVGGGYASNLLAHEPLRWILDGARRAGLICEDVSQVPALRSSRLLRPRDSFAEFAPFWRNVLRAKRFYRTIDPEPEVRAIWRRRDQPGVILAHINEHIDESVARYWAKRSNPPPNLVEYARRHAARHPHSVMASLAAMVPHHTWMGDGFTPYLGLVAWATVAAIGILVVDQVFMVWQASLPPAWVLAVAAGLFALIDWAESSINFTIAARGESPPRRVLLDSIYWTRVIGVVLFFFGAVGTLVHLVTLGTGASSLSDILLRAATSAHYSSIISLGAGLGVGLGVVFNHLYARSPSPPPAQTVIQAALVGPPATYIFLLVTTVSVYEVWRVTGQAPVSDVPVSSLSLVGERFAGLLLLLQLALIGFINALSWAGKPMARARLGSILPLRLFASPRGVKACLDRWCSMLSCHRPHGSTPCHMRAIVQETVYRDVVGFVPIYSVVVTFALWFGASQLGWSWLANLWLAIPLTTAIAGYIESACHLRYLRLHWRDASLSGLFTGIVATLSWIGLFGRLTASTLTLAIVTAATVRIYDAPDAYGWRGLMALVVSIIMWVVLTTLTVWPLLYRTSMRTGRIDKDPPPSRYQERSEEEPEAAGLA